MTKKSFNNITAMEKLDSHVTNRNNFAIKFESQFFIVYLITALYYSKPKKEGKMNSQSSKFSQNKHYHKVIVVATLVVIVDIVNRQKILM